MDRCPSPHELVGEHPDDHGDIKLCLSKTFVALAPRMNAYDWESPTRGVPNPDEVENGPFTELRLAPSPAAAVAGMVVRRRKSSRQSISQVLRDVKRAAIYRVKAPGVRVKDGHLDGRLVAGALGLRMEGEQAQERLEDRALVAAGSGSSQDDSPDTGISDLWATVDKSFEESVAALELPDDAVHPTLKVDWTLIGSVERLDLLTENKLFNLPYVGQSCVTWRDLLRMKDITGRPVGLRFLYYVGREASYDFISVGRKSGVRDWLKFLIVLLTAISSLGSLGWLLSQIF